MADGTPYLDTSLTLREKYPNSKRLDHPNFADVYKTTYAKGVITEFKKLQDDPIKVESMVKVDIDGEETDFIPLFYHPKKQYWDDDEHQAQDFNEEKGYFEKAWMSFRVNDEVVVMLREGKPFAVIGFADTVPRIGENIIKIHFTQPVEGSEKLMKFFKCHLPDYYDNGPVGPDGADLKLFTEAEMVNQNTEALPRDNYPSDRCIIMGAIHIYGDPGNPHESWGNIQVDELHKCINFQILEWIVWHNNYDISVTEFFMKVGPIAYLIQILSRYRSHSYDWTYQYWSGCHHFDHSDVYGLWWYAPPPCTYPDENIFVGTDGDPLAEKPDGMIMDIHIKAAIYTPEIEKQIKAGPDVSIGPIEANDLWWNGFKDWTNQYNGFVDQTSLRNKIRSYLHGQQYRVTKESSKFHVRPHTKSELEAAGMWPT